LPHTFDKEIGDPFDINLPGGIFDDQTNLISQIKIKGSIQGKPRFPLPGATSKLHTDIAVKTPVCFQDSAIGLPGKTMPEA
jgi:hypothetical protein